MSRKSLLSILLCAVWFLVLLPAVAQATVTGGVFVYDNPNGSLQSGIETDLVSEFSQSSPYDYSVVTSMKITGVMKAADYTFIKNNLKNYLQNLDLSGFSGSFPNYALQGCSSIETVRLPASAPASQGMFLECSSLKTLVVGDGAFEYGVIDLRGAVASFNNEVFRKCSSIEAVRLPAGASISKEMFSGCSSLKSLVVGGGVLEDGVIDLSGAISFEHNTFYGCQSIKTVRLPAGKEIPVSMFNRCSKLKTLMVGNGAFEYGVVDLRGATSFENHVFYGCGSIEAVRLPVGAVIPNYMFFGCSSLKTLVVGDGVLDDGVIDLSGYTQPSFGVYPFELCSSIETVRLPAGVAISDQMFRDCSSLKTLVVGNGALEDGVIDLNGAASFNYGAFYSCQSIETVRLPTSAAIPGYMFNDCSSLSTVLFTGATAPAIGTQAFTGSPAVAYVPDKNSGGYEETAFTNHFPQGVHNLIPELVTETVTGLTASGATLSGQITSGGGTPVTERGFVYAITANPVIGDSGVIKITAGSGTGSFTEALSGLTAGTTYYVRAYATNSFGTGYGAEVSFTTPLSSDATLSDLVISEGSLTPSFASGTYTYTASVGNSVSSLTVTPTASDTNASVNVNDTVVASGAASSDIALSVGDNIVTTIVTAQDGVTTQTYTITITRAASGGGSSTTHYYTIEASADPGGKISPSGNVTVRKGQSQTFTITPEEGYRITKVEADGQSLGIMTTYTFENISQAHTIKACFEAIEVPMPLEEEKENEETEPPVINNPFTDIAEGDWFYDDVLYVYGKGIMVGVSPQLFAPDTPLTRGMFVTLLYRLSGESATYENLFSDVAAGAWYENPAAWATAKRICQGMGGGLFAPGQAITREQLAVILYNYAKYMGYDVSVDTETSLHSYNDAHTISDYAYTALQWASATGIMGGDEVGNLNPRSGATRAEAAALLQRFIEKIAEQQRSRE